MAVTISLMRVMSMPATLGRRGSRRAGWARFVTKASAGRDEERLGRVADGPVAVVQGRACDAGAVVTERRARGQSDPIATRLARHLDREVEVDEQEASEVQDVRDAIAEVRCGGQRLERRGGRG